MRARGKGSSQGRVEGSSRAMLATAKPSCFILSYIAFRPSSFYRRAVDRPIRYTHGMRGSDRSGSAHDVDGHDEVNKSCRQTSHSRQHEHTADVRSSIHNTTPTIKTFSAERSSMSSITPTLSSTRTLLTLYERFYIHPKHGATGSYCSACTENLESQ